MFERRNCKEDSGFWLSTWLQWECRAITEPGRLFPGETESLLLNAWHLKVSW